MPSKLGNLFDDLTTNQVVLCMTNQPDRQYKLFGYKTAEDLWKAVEQFDFSSNEYSALYPNWNLSAPAIKQGGYLYHLLCSENSGLSSMDCVRYLNAVVEKHDRQFTIVPQADIFPYIAQIPAGVDQATLRLTITWAKPKSDDLLQQVMRPNDMKKLDRPVYLLHTMFIPGMGNVTVEPGLDLDPLPLSAALRCQGWRVAYTPSHRPTVGMANQEYNVGIERSDTPNDLLISGKTDLQLHRDTRNKTTMMFVQHLQSQAVA